MALVVMTILLTLAGPRTLSALDRRAVRSARMELVSALGAARVLFALVGFSHCAHLVRSPGIVVVG
ncbi:MAG: hypothetical protein JJD97_11030, partial [Gemmatimonadaceae bacterium]|nr:hypothetical protein [Gemmatimonadaceae bacterium]